MAEIKQLFQVTTLPGIKRDGTVLDGDQCSDGQWVRFQRGRAKKIGGFQQITNRLSGIINSTLVWSRSSMNAIYTFSQGKIEMVLVDNDGLGSSIIDRTPAGFVSSTNHIWSTTTLYNAGGTTTAVLCHASSSMSNIDDSTVSTPYYADASGAAAFTAIAGTGPSATGVSGGVFCVAPYAFYLSSDGYIQWSDANQPTVLTSGDAGDGRITGAKLVKGLPLRSGSGPGALIWSLDSVVRMDYSGGQNLFKFSHLSSQTSILAQNSVIEYDGVYYWIGIDRFLMCDGGQVKELPNQMNINWFFDNLNYTQRQKVWAMKIPRFGEIWWFFPFGDSTECTNAVIYNTREQTWYDVSSARSSGFYSQVFKYPVMTNAEATTNEVALTVSGTVGTISVGDRIVGATSGAMGTVVDIIGSTYYAQISTPGKMFIALEGLTDVTSAATATAATVSPLYQAYLHEKGHDRVEGDEVVAIDSYFTTADFGYPTGGSKQNNITGLNCRTRLVRIEPDMLQEQDMTLVVSGREFANAPELYSDPYTYSPETVKIDMREQRREIRLTFRSNVVGGHYEMGRTIIHLEPGDVRS